MSNEAPLSAPLTEQTPVRPSLTKTVIRFEAANECINLDRRTTEVDDDEVSAIDEKERGDPTALEAGPTAVECETVNLSDVVNLDAPVFTEGRGTTQFAQKLEELRQKRKQEPTMACLEAIRELEATSGGSKGVSIPLMPNL